MSEEDPPELIFGVVAGIGTPRNVLIKSLTRSLGRAGYRTFPTIKLSDMLAKAFGWEPKSRALESAITRYNEWEQGRTRHREARIDRLMDLGNELRRQTNAGDVLSLLAMLEVRKLRKEHAQQDDLGPLRQKAVIIDSLKNPREARLLRKVYGPRFHLVAVYAPHQQRIDHLAEDIAKSHGGGRLEAYRHEAHRLAKRDREETEDDLGQNVSETFAEADFFVDVRRVGDQALHNEVDRYIDLIFGNPFETPRHDEYGMHLAFGAAVRSSSLPRQVGSAVLTPDGSTVTTGFNEVPKATGGHYPSETNPVIADARDFLLHDRDPSDQMRANVLQDVLERLDAVGWLSPHSVNEGASPTMSEMIEHLMLPDQHAREQIRHLIGDVLEQRQGASEELSTLVNSICRAIGEEGDDRSEHERTMRENVHRKRAELKRLISAFLEGKPIPRRYLDYLVEQVTSPVMRGSQVVALSEFMRTVHAEMSAITDCARRGLALQGSTLYCTTFPCHECTRHIIATGIDRVVYIEPYPKSYAEEYHSDAILLEGKTSESPHVRFEPFLGVGPSRYLECFQLSTKPSKRKGEGGRKLDWDIHGKFPKYRELALNYIHREEKTLAEFAKSAALTLDGI